MTTWLNGIVGETAGPTASLIVSIILIAIAIIVLVWIARLLLGGRFSLRHHPELRLQVVDATAIDNRRKLVLVRRDNVEHLIVIGGQNDLVVETGIVASVANVANVANVSEQQRAPKRTNAQPAQPAMPSPAKRQTAEQHPAPVKAAPQTPAAPAAPATTVSVSPAKTEPPSVDMASIPAQPTAKPAAATAPVIAPAPTPSQQIRPQPKTDKAVAPDVELASSNDFEQNLDDEMDALINTLTTKNG